MKNILMISCSALLLITFASCSKEPQEPYFDRAKSASENAQEQLRRD